MKLTKGNYIGVPFRIISPSAGSAPGIWSIMDHYAFNVGSGGNSWPNASYIPFAVIAGGGSGGSGNGLNYGGSGGASGGGGGGGVVYGYLKLVPGIAGIVTIGGGAASPGKAPSTPGTGNQGSSSALLYGSGTTDLTLTVYGGGGGGGQINWTYCQGCQGNAGSGGNGGGGVFATSWYNTNALYTPGAGQNPVMGTSLSSLFIGTNPLIGNPGGYASTGGGGGAGGTTFATPSAAAGQQGAAGGAGVFMPFINAYVGGSGAGGSVGNTLSAAGGLGGGGGGAGLYSSDGTTTNPWPHVGQPGLTNTGGGGGGGWTDNNDDDDDVGADGGGGGFSEVSSPSYAMARIVTPPDEGGGT